MSSSAELFSQAWQYHQAQDFVRAERLYRQVLQGDPVHADAWCFLGAVCQAQGNPAEAERCYRRALELVPAFASAHNCLGIVLANQGRLEEAAGSFERLLRLYPDDPDGWNNLGLVRAQQGRLDEAVANYQRALQQRPDFPAARSNLDEAWRQRGGTAQPPSAPAPSPAAVQTARLAIQRGIGLARQGRLDDAAAAFREAAQAQPDSADAPNNLGSVLVSQGRLPEAIASYRRALQLKPDFAAAHYNLGVALEQQGQREEAAASYRQALRSDAGHLDARNNLGNVLRAQGDGEGALACYRDVLRRKPDFVEVLLNVGITLGELGKWDEAEASFRHALRLQPGYADAHNGLGNALNHCGRKDEAVASYREALRLRPDFAEAHNNLGNALSEQNQLEEAVACYREALRLRPEFAQAFSNLGNALRQQDRIDEAIVCYQEALRVLPDYAEPHTNWGNALKQQGKLADALGQYDQALRLDPAHADTHFNRALVWLAQGDFERGWPEYEWRWRTDAFPRIGFARPRWDGSHAPGRTILVHAEQGLGDTVQFIRLVPRVRERCGKVIVQCQPSLKGLLDRGPGIDQVIAQGTPPEDFDLHVPLLSLPGVLGTTLENIPAKVPYLSTEPRCAETWRRRLAEFGPGYRVGVVWQGSPRHRQDRQRSLPLAQLLFLTRIEGVRLFSLQVGPGSEQLASLPEPAQVHDLGSRFDPDSLEDAAAALVWMDLVVTVDTAIAHLAGALAVPVWVALPAVADWRWLLDRDDSPWYPSMRLFRQRTTGQWQEVLDRIEADLQQLLAKRSPKVPAARPRRRKGDR